MSRGLASAYDEGTVTEGALPSVDLVSITWDAKTCEKGQEHGAACVDVLSLYITCTPHGLCDVLRRLTDRTRATVPHEAFSGSFCESLHLPCLHHFYVHIDCVLTQQSLSFVRSILKPANKDSMPTIRAPGLRC